MSQHWTRYIEDLEYEDGREYVKNKKKKKQKLNHEQEQKLKETKKDGTKYPKKPKR